MRRFGKLLSKRVKTSINFGREICRRSFARCHREITVMLSARYVVVLAIVSFESRFHAPTHRSPHAVGSLFRGKIPGQGLRRLRALATRAAASRVRDVHGFPSGPGSRLPCFVTVNRTPARPTRH